MEDAEKIVYAVIEALPVEWQRDIRNHDGSLNVHGSATAKKIEAALEAVLPNHDSMWINAFSIVQASNETKQLIGEEVITALKATQNRVREPLEPIFKAYFRIVAS